MRQDSPYGQIHVKYDDLKNGSAFTPAEPTETKMKKADALNLMLIAAIIGMCVLGFHYLGEWSVTFISKTPLADYYSDSQAAFMIVQIIHSLCAILIPFSVGGFLIQKLCKDREIIPLWKPNSLKNFFFAIGIGFVTLVIGNYITTFFVLGMESFGVFFQTGEVPNVETASDFFWQVLATALVPALVEEFAVRGVIMQSLRKYGDIFAIVVSALLFAILHGNMVQAPFALLLGCIMGWLVIITDSLWTGIAIHFMNNFYAVVMNTLLVTLPEHMYIIVFLSINAVGVVLGVMAFFRIDSKYKRKDAFYEPGGNTSLAQMKYRVKAIILTIISPPMFMAIYILIGEITDTIMLFGW